MDGSAYQCKLNKVGSTIKVLALQQYAGLALRTTPRGPPGNHPTPGGARAPERTRKSRLEQHPHGQDSGVQPYSPHQNIRVPQIKKKNPIDLCWDPCVISDK